MSLEYLTLKMPVLGLPSVASIETTLKKWGDPVRWAITHVQDQECTIEAVVYHTGSDLSGSASSAKKTPSHS